MGDKTQCWHTAHYAVFISSAVALDLDAKRHGTGEFM